ncbi:Response regulator receiver protein [Pseudodesulfovibrio profundus]|uniref:Response regulator receiver protein n=1 Tax=Pseudodesulfovibrio profundus TaxID=57320 RepID=A0A2C8F9U7_9BACT|nr:response regulator [Pseudodesulfovibrio profundus]MBC17793.1 response regulator [Desulfovibrio sp.]SOB59201.1 Response regulator receiver protein [Pseudodesulfovibrio profundus]
MKTIMVVDDAPMIRELIKSVLEAEGFDVVEAADGEEAIRLFQDKEVDLSIIDIFLPKKGGLQVMGELIKSEKPHKFIAISGGEAFNPEAIVELAKVFDVVDTFTKPIDTRKLVETVKKALAE